MIYDFTTPSDAITFKADSDKVAYVCAIILGSGKAGCENTETKTSLPTMLMFSKDPEKDMLDFMGCDMPAFMKEHRQEIAAAFNSFAYGSLSHRKTYDVACEAITDPEQLKKFRLEHENNNRTSMSKWVLSAWNLGEKFKKDPLEK